MKIDFFIIGAQKCATTWLYNCLHAHPDIFIGGEKREVNYLGGEKFKEKGEEWFYSLFEAAEAQQLIGSASVDYLIDREAIQYIKKNNPDAQIILSIRNPINRLISAYYWLGRNNLTEDLPLNEGISKIFDAYNTESLSDEYDQIIKRGQYYNLLKYYLEEFPKENFKVIVFDDIKEKPDEVLIDLYNFLGVDNSYKPLSKSRKPKGNSYNKLLINLERRLPDKKIFKKGISLISEFFKLTRMSGNKLDDVKQKHLKSLEEIFQNDIEQMKKVIKKLPDKSKPISGKRQLEKWY